VLDEYAILPNLCVSTATPTAHTSTNFELGANHAFQQDEVVVTTTLRTVKVTFDDLLATCTGNTW